MSTVVTAPSDPITATAQPGKVKMSPRLAKLTENILPEKYPLCFERAVIFTESHKMTEGQPQILRMAQGLASILEEMTIFILDGELLVGNKASKPMGVEITTGSGTWPKEELEALRAEGWDISIEDEAVLAVINQYWRSKTGTHLMSRLYDDKRLWPYMQAGVFPPPWTTKDQYPNAGAASTHMPINAGFEVIDFARVLNCGLEDVIQEAAQELAQLRFTNPEAISKADFLNATIISHKAIIHFAERFALLAAKMAGEEADAVRRKELERIAETCRQVPAKPARTFYEAMQSFWFMFLVIESGISPYGRFDQFMYPFYQRDKEAGRITEEEALELLQCLRVKDMQTNVTYVRAQQRAKWAGMAKWHNMVIGGVTPDGHDATNDLTYLILEAARRCPVPHHTITVRVHEGTPETLMLKALEVVKTGIGLPAFVGDKSYIEYFLSHSVPLADARDYALAGCLDGVIPMKTRIGYISLFVVPLVFDFFLHNGVEPRTGKQLGPQTGALASFQSFDDLMSAWKKHLVHFMALETESNTIIVEAKAAQLPNALVSSLMVDGIKVGQDLMRREFPFNPLSPMGPVGMVNVVDSLAAIKKLVFDDKQVAAQELLDALDSNWQGDRNQEIRRLCLAAPKFGNGDPLPDSIARDLYKFWAHTVVSFGRQFVPEGVSITTHGPGGALTGATPDGRYAGELLADGSVSPAQGRDTHGPTAVIMSASKIDQVPYQSTLLNVKFHPSALNSADDLRKLSHLVRVYFGLGGKHIQFNVVNRETLMDAQKHPENHRDLVVRVAGYSAYFVQLSKSIQDDLIRRAEHEAMI